MKINLAHFKEGTHQLNFEEEPPTLPTVDRGALNHAVQISIALERGKNQILITGKLSTTIKLPCDRCLSPVTKPITSAFRVLYASHAYRGAEGAGDYDDIRPLPGPDASIDLTPDIVDSLALSIPMKVLCRETCRGLCAICGADLNKEACRCKPTADSRWESLRGLLVDDSAS